MGVGASLAAWAVGLPLVERVPWVRREGCLLSLVVIGCLGRQVRRTWVKYLGDVDCNVAVRFTSRQLMLREGSRDWIQAGWVDRTVAEIAIKGVGSATSMNARSVEGISDPKSPPVQHSQTPNRYPYADARSWTDRRFALLQVVYDCCSGSFGYCSSNSFFSTPRSLPSFLLL